MIEVSALRKRFVSGSGRKKREVQAVDGVHFTAADGCITGLLGANGAGKTTTLRMVAALIEPDEGQVRVDGVHVAARPRDALARLGLLSDARGLYPRLTARENIVYFGRLHGMDGAAASARAEHLAQVLDMAPLLDRRTDGFSQGERMKTALARALVHNPPNIVLDEPPTAWTCWPRARCATRCAGCVTTRASASSSPPTSCKRWSGCATWWWWWRRAARWLPARSASCRRKPAAQTSRRPL